MSSSPHKKEKFLDRLADEHSVAVVVVDPEGGVAASANDNSMCRALSSSNAFGSECAKFCGRAFDMVLEAGKTVGYECYAGLNCRAVPVWESGKPYAAIVGRTFLKAEKYKEATEKAITGEWRQFRPTEFFENVLISGSGLGLEKTVKRLEKFSDRTRNDILELERLTPRQPVAAVIELDDIDIPAMPDPEGITGLINKFRDESEKAAADIESAEPMADDVEERRKAASRMRSLFSSLMQLEYHAACRSVLEYLQERYSFGSLAWLEPDEEQFKILVAVGSLGERQVRIGINGVRERLQDSVRHELPLEFKQRGRTNDQADQWLTVFPVMVGGEIHGAIGIDTKIAEKEQKRSISRFVHALSSQLEILRLRDEVARREWLSKAVLLFNDNLRRIDADDFWLRVTQMSAELLGAERASILVKDDKEARLRAKAAVGAKIDLVAEHDIGTRVASRVLEIGEPVVIDDVNGLGIDSAPSEWSYKTPSFLSYPIAIGDRKIGVINFTDKVAGDTFSARDLEVLRTIAPQIAVAIDRMTLRDKAGEFEQLSVTDPLTGLLNRRYLEERIAEEIMRSKRHRFSLSLMMLDVDNFKSYNDSFGHLAGDTALKMVADILKETLRGADVAARYGGEEFAILLPQTSVDEAAQIAERIRRRIERTSFPDRQVTVSIGIAACSNDVDKPAELISAADSALYAAKDSGRNNVQVFEDWDGAVNENIH